MKKKPRVVATAAIALGIGTFTSGQQARADTPPIIQIAISTDVTIVPGQHVVAFTGRPSSVSTVTCAPGTAQPQSVVVVDPGGGGQAQRTEVIAYHDHAIPSGARYVITSEGTACSTDLRLYTATLT